MAEDEVEIQQAFAQIRAFEWDEQKRAINLEVRKIDFQDVKGIFDGYAFARRSDRHDEIRYQVFGYVEGREVAVICTIRDDICRIISARRARRDERQKYYGGVAGRSPQGQD